MKLSLLTGTNGGHDKIDVTGITADSRQVKPGYLFAAFSGTQTDGAKFVGSAIEQGAVAVLAAPDVTPVKNDNILWLTDNNPRRRYAHLVSRFFAPQPDTVVAVTGTNGKSSVVDFTRQIWMHLGLKAASIGTLGVNRDGVLEPLGLTTPDAVVIHQQLAALKDAQVDHVAIEASSHGLSQYRLDGVRLTAGAFTSFSRDHLDYHASVEDYLYAKLRLFGELLPPGATAVINTDMPAFPDVEGLCWARGLRILSTGSKGVLRLVSAEPLAQGQRLDLRYGGQEYALDLPLVGDFQVENALVAAGLAIATGGQPGPVFEALGYLRGVPGRLQLVGFHPSGAAVYVDYAHTPHALQSALKALRAHTDRHLVVVFGCGGDRDTGKRPEMGHIAGDLADRVIITDDNPRSEDPASIRAQILEQAGHAEDIGDRRKAIVSAVSDLSAGDVLLIAGKGHETGQIVGSTVLPFDDAAEARQALEAIGGRST